MSERPYQNPPKFIQHIAVKWVGLPALALSAVGLIVLTVLALATPSWKSQLRRTNPILYSTGGG